MNKSTGWQIAMIRAREHYMLDTPPGSLLALTLHLIALRDEIAADDVSLANVRYELNDPAALHEALNAHCPPLAMPEPPTSLHAVPHWPRYPATDPVQMRRAWLLTNASGPDTTPTAWPGDAALIAYPDTIQGASFFPRAVDSLRGVLDETLLAQVGGLPLRSQAQVLGGPDDGLQGFVGGVVWNLDDARRCVTVPASYRIYGHGADARIPADALHPLPGG
ncbi:hypothetical protein [Streptomyces sp. NPDC001492]